ncbi:translation initiation factor IF-2-like [Pipra filicauda]|uniref:Translation initiation factor IF-2-like n=1 Tax=Pipra filicauda TaxID=649802 RepID=A0A7R5KZR0_9PASS|nr:translation initiation factor IF-2-like [Pipra filicauda]
MAEYHFQLPPTDGTPLCASLSPKPAVLQPPSRLPKKRPPRRRDHTATEVRRKNFPVSSRYRLFPVGCPGEPHGAQRSQGAAWPPTCRGGGSGAGWDGSEGAEPGSDTAGTPEGTLPGRGGRSERRGRRCYPATALVPLPTGKPGCPGGGKGELRERE